MRRAAERLAPLALLLALVQTPATAHAQAQPQNAASLQHFDAGRKAFTARDFQTALTEFQASLDLQPSPNTRLYIARCYRGLGKVASASTSYKLASGEATDRLNASGEKRYKATRDAADAEAAELVSRVPRLALLVPPGAAPEGLVVKLDGQEIPKAAWGQPVETDPGKHEVTASGPRLVPLKDTLELAEGELKRYEVKVARLPTAYLAVALRSRPEGLAIELDGKPLDVAAAEKRAELDVGAHTVVAHAPGYVDFVWKRELVNGEDVVVPLELKPRATPVVERASGGTPKWLFFTVAGATVAVLGAGTVVALGARSRSDEQQAVDPLLRSPAEREDLKSQTTLANALLIGGGVLGLGTGVLLFTTRWKTTPRPLTGWVGPTGGGLAGTF